MTALNMKRSRLFWDDCSLSVVQATRCVKNAIIFKLIGLRADSILVKIGKMVKPRELM
jgi:hypothetical protein